MGDILLDDYLTLAIAGDLEMVSERHQSLITITRVT